jgi:hypothetical protein
MEVRTAIVLGMPHTPFDASGQPPLGLRDGTFRGVDGVVRLLSGVLGIFGLLGVWWCGDGGMGDWSGEAFSAVGVRE